MLSKVAADTRLNTHDFEAASKRGRQLLDLFQRQGRARVPPEMLDELYLCRRPEQDRFAEHLRLFEQRFGVDPRRIAAVLRRVEVLEVLPSEEEGAQGVSADAYLLAARDHSDDDETNS